MNEQIKTMWEEATGSVWPRPGKFTAGENEANLTKFAKLIIRECALQIADVRIENDFEPVGDAVLAKALAGIEQHFGVEE